MERTDNSAASRECATCKKTLPYTTEYWPADKDVARGLVCRLCARNRKRDLDRTRKQTWVAARTQPPAATPAASATSAKSGDASTAVDKPRDDLPPLRQLGVARALRIGAARLNEAAQGILETLLEYAANSQSPHHEWALRLIAERIIPKKLYEDLGSQAAGISAGQGTIRPAVTIIVQPASPAATEPSIQVVEGTSERVEPNE